MLAALFLHSAVPTARRKRDEGEGWRVNGRDKRQTDSRQILSPERIRKRENAKEGKNWEEATLSSNL